MNMGINHFATGERLGARVTIVPECVYFGVYSLLMLVILCLLYMPSSFNPSSYEVSSLLRLTILFLRTGNEFL
jgi:hypothetical protein